MVILVIATACGSVGGGSGGTKIALSAKVDGVWRLVAVNADGSRSKVLPHPTDVVKPVWAPNGRAIAFLLDEQLLTIDEDGSDERVVAPHADFDWGWSPDSSRLFFTYNDIGVVKSDGTDRHLLVRCEPDECGSPVWSPDSGRLAYSSRRGRAISVIDVDGADEQVVARCRDVQCERPAWAPDGHQIAFALQKTTGEGEPRGLRPCDRQFRWKQHAGHSPADA